MFKWLFVVNVIFFSSVSFANVNINLACKEKTEQKKSLLLNMSTSVTEAHLAGQCAGYKKLESIKLADACTEYIEQKKSLLESLSTTLTEAHYAGYCVGAIYIEIKKCKEKNDKINYMGIAQLIVKGQELRKIEKPLGCKRVDD